MGLNTYPPCAALQPFVQEYFIFEDDVPVDKSYKQIVSPTGFPSIIFHFGDLDLVCHDHNGNSHHPPRAAIIGQLTYQHHIQHIGRVGVLGAYFKPSAIFQLFGEPAWKFTDRSTDLNLVIGEDAHKITAQLINAADNERRIRLIERFLLNRLSVVDKSLGLLNNAILKKDAFSWLTIDELAGQLGMSKRQLQRKFKTEIGVSPQTYKKVIRFNQVMRDMGHELPKEWQELTFESGYYDQAHMIREFKRFTGKPPQVFIKQETQFSFRQPE